MQQQTPSDLVGPEAMLITATAAAATATLTVSSASTSTAADADTLSTRSCDWRYLSEGKLNVVFTHAHATEAAAPARGVDSQLSPQQQQQTERIHSSVPHAMAGRVLKISKNVLRLSLDPSCTPAQLAARLQHTLHYVHRILSPLLQAAAASIAAQSARSAAGSTEAAVAAAAAAAACWADAGRIVWLPKETVAEMFDAALISRPKKRVLDYARFDASRCCSPLLPMLLMEDYTSPLHLHLHLQRRILDHGQSLLLPPMPLLSSPSCARPTVCLELKPKWGFLPSATAVAASAIAFGLSNAEGGRGGGGASGVIAPEKLRCCRFCMHQLLKLSLGEVAEHSAFCPLDLYSCEPERVRRALEQLLRTPQNNLRIFIRTGAPATSSSSSSATATAPEEGGFVQLLDVHNADQLDMLLSLLFPSAVVVTSASSSSSAASSHATRMELLLSLLTSFVCDAPPMCSLLRSLRLLQSRLDALDIEGVAPLYERIMQRESNLALDEHVLWHGLDQPEGGLAWIRPVLTALAPSAEAQLQQLHRHQSSSASPSTNSADELSSVFDFPPSSSSSSSAAVVAQAARETDNKVPVCAHWAPAAAQSFGETEAVPTLPFHPCGDSDEERAACETRGGSTASASSASSSSAQHSNSSTGSTNAVCLCAEVNSLRAFLVATTLKDVCIMSTLQRTDDNERGTARSSSSSSSASVEPSPLTLRTRLLYSVRLVDLECKSVGKMREYLRLDRAIVEHYRRTADSQQH